MSRLLQNRWARLGGWSVLLMVVGVVISFVAFSGSGDNSFVLDGVVGESDAKGELPKGDPISPDDVAASFFQSLGIDPKKEYYTPTGRPVAIIPNGHVIPELFS